MQKSRFEIPFFILRIIAWCIMKPFFRIEIRGQAVLNACDQGVILAGNHTGLLDSLTLLVACQRYFRFLMIDEVFSWEWVGKLVPYGNIIPLYQDRHRRVLVETVQQLRQGMAICIFPEGKLTQDGALNPFNKGVAYLQQKSGMPIVPFAISGGFEAWPQAQKWPRFRKIILQFGEPIQADLCETREKVIQTLEQRVQIMKLTLDGQQEKPANIGSTVGLSERIAAAPQLVELSYYENV